MKLRRLAAICLLGSTLLPLSAQTNGAWTLQDCLDYALKNNIQVKKGTVAAEQGEVSLSQQKAQLLPSLSFSTNQSMGYRPFQQSTNIVQNGQVTSTSNKVTYQGSYNLSAQWTVWNGGINRMNIEAQELKNEQTAISNEQTALSLQEQIANLYVTILYTTEAQKVAEQLAATAKTQWERAQEMQRQGQLAKAEVARLEAQMNSAQYDVVSSQTQIANYKRQMKSLLQIDLTKDFDVAGQIPTHEQVMALIPSAEQVYNIALATRPEIRGAEKSIEAAQLQERIAKAGYLPTVSMNASVGDSHYSASHEGAGTQMKRNINGNLGVSLSVPIFDQKRNKSAVEQAKLQHTTSQLDLADRKSSLSSTIEEYWLNAQSNQQRYLAAKSTVESQQESYNLLNEQFKEGLKNTVDLLQGRDALINAEQNMLQSKYNTLLYVQLLKFYSGEGIRL